MRRLTALAASSLFVVSVFAGTARAETINFDLSGKTYTKFMFQNNDSRGCLSLSNPFWVDNIGGSNGVCTEFELNIKGNVGPRVTTGVRLQSRWGALWQGWWENGAQRLGVEDTSGESLGMNHAQYIKLRAAWARFAPPLPAVRWITVGSTDMGMWNEWTIGKARYIDRDNAGAVTFEGDLLPGKLLSYTTGAIALPKLFVGPGWNTGLKDNEPLASLWGTDWAYAVKLNSQPINDLRLRLVGTMTQDWEADRFDPDKTGPADTLRDADHAINLVTRMRSFNGTLDAVYSPSKLDWLTATGLLALSHNNVNPEYATNLVRNGQGFSPVLFTLDENGNPRPSNGYAGKLLLELFDPLSVGLSAKFEYFNIGEEFNAIMGARREADVLLTEGIITDGWHRGGQLPTLNVANEFVDFDEPWYESIIGWHGGTGLLEYVNGNLKTSAEYTFIGYNTNKQGRDVRNQYPDFLYTHGFTDVAAFTADSDYANVYDRGKDPRSVYTEFQDRRTHLAILNLEWLVPKLPGVVLTVKGKYVNDADNRKLDNPNDDYFGQMLMGFGAVSWQVNNELKTSLGYEYQHWDENARSGTQAGGFYDYVTDKHTARAGFSYMFGGVIFTYMLEYFHKELDRATPGSFDQTWNVWRGKGTFEVGW